MWRPAGDARSSVGVADCLNSFRASAENHRRASAEAATLAQTLSAIASLGPQEREEVLEAIESMQPKERTAVMAALEGLPMAKEISSSYSADVEYPGAQKLEERLEMAVEKQVQQHLSKLDTAQRELDDVDNRIKAGKAKPEEAAAEKAELEELRLEMAPWRFAWYCGLKNRNNDRIT